jgi:hypothetical protein
MDMTPTTTATTVAIPAIASTNVGSPEPGPDPVPGVSCSIVQNVQSLWWNTLATAAA